MWHVDTVPLVSPRSTLAQSLAPRGSSTEQALDPRLARDYFGDWAERWPSQPVAASALVRRPRLPEPTATSPSETVVFSARGTPLVARIRDVPPSLLNLQPAWGESFVDEQNRRHIYVNVEAATLHRVLDFQRDKKVPLSLAPGEVRALKRAAEMFEDRELLCHLGCIWPFRVDARDAKGTPGYPEKLFALAQAWEQCGHVELAEKKRNKALAWYVATLPRPAPQLSMPMPIGRQPSDEDLLFPFEDDSLLMAPLLTSGWQRSSQGSPSEVGPASWSSDEQRVPWTPSPTNSLDGAMNFSHLGPSSSKRAAW